MSTNGNLSLWKSVEKTDPQHTKGFSGKGGFKGTAISPMWLIRRATELWGPMGGKWGVRNVKAEVLDGPGQEKLHVVQAEIFYPLPQSLGDGTNFTQVGAVPCFGQTTLCGVRKDGTPFLDEEAPKKSLTDALTKGLSWLGFAADVHMGLYDDVKYVNTVNEEFRKAEQAPDPELREKGGAILKAAAVKGTEALTAAWKTLSQPMREACRGDWGVYKDEATRQDAARQEMARAKANGEEAHAGTRA